ncbi:MAG: chromosomal replication initiator protein DnaA [Candidatus Curtissbacteria bacterium]
MSGQKIWNNILVNLKTQVSTSIYKTWFSGTFVLDLKNEGERDLLIIGVRNSFVREQIESRYKEAVLKSAQDGGHENLSVVFVVSQKKEIPTSKNEPLFSGRPLDFMASAKSPDSLNLAHTFDNFVVGFSNNLAYLAATQVASSLGTLYNPFLIYGPTGVGKTHLLQSIGNDVLSKTLNAKVLYVSAEKFTNDYIESLNNKTQQAFRAKYRNVDVLLVDDVQFLAGKESTQDEFFYTFNELYLSGKQIILASDKHPKEIGRLKERLVSRFVGGMAASITYPDLEMKMAIVRAKCKEKGVFLEPAVIDFLAQSCQGGARELEGSLVSVLALSKISGGRVDLEEVKAAAFRGIASSSPAVTPGKIMDVVCRHFRVSTADLCGPSRKSGLVAARQTLMYLLRKQLGLPLAAIGEMLGGRDHSTVIHGIEKTEAACRNQVKNDEILRLSTMISTN